MRFELHSVNMHAEMMSPIPTRGPRPGPGSHFLGWLVRALATCGWLAGTAPAAGTEVASFASGGTGWQLGTFAVGKLDGSPGCDIVVPYRDANGNWFLDAFKFTGQRLAGFPCAAGGEPINVSPTLFDVDGDGREEILFTRGNHVIALRGDGSLMWSNTVDSSSYVPTGGFQTVTNGFYWWPGGAWMDHLPPTAQFFSEVSPLQVMDLKGDGHLEVISAWKIRPDPITGGQDYNPFIFPVFGVGEWGTMGENWSGGVVTFSAGNGRQTSVYHFHHLVESGLAVGRPDFGDPLNIYALNDSDSVVAFDKSQPFGLWGKGMLHRQFGKNQRLMTGSYQVPIDVYTADIDGDGQDEVLVAGTQLSSLWQPNETILDDDGGILWRRWLPHLDLTNNSGWLNSASLIPVNPDHDNHIDVLGWNHSYELTFRFWNGIELVDRPGWPKNFYPLLPTPPVVGDVDGDGQEEIIVGTYDPAGTSSAGDLRIYALDGTLKQSIPVAGGVKQIPALADVEGVGRLDVICLSARGQMHVWNFGSASTNLVSWATHRGNMRRDGNCGLSLYPPGTPMIRARVAGYNRASFSWINSASPQWYRVYRAMQATGPFLPVATLTPDTSSYTDEGLQAGWQYFYEVGADYQTNVVRSAPFAILPLYNGNLVANPGFERDDNCRWDKWSGSALNLASLGSCTNVAYQGCRSMQVLLQGSVDGSSIAQNNQYGIPDSSINVSPGAFYSFGGFVKATGASLPSEHWFEWSSTKTGADTRTRPVLPDPFYYTAHLLAGTTGADWTYLNRTFQLPPGFPNIELRHRYSLSGATTGAVYLDNVFFRQIPSPTATNWTSLIPFGAAWRYSTTLPPAAWFSPGFNDTAWPWGQAKFGAGSGPTNIVTRLPQWLPAYSFRRQFTLASTNIEELLLAATCTDVSVAKIYPLQLYLNGHLIPSTIDTVTMQGNEVRYFDLIPFASFLKPGTNTLATQIGNTWSDYDDVAFDLCLTAVFYHPTLPQLSLQNSPASGSSLSAELPAGTVWQVQSSETLSPANWQSIQTLTNDTGSTRKILNLAPGHNFIPGAAPTRFFRLTPY